MAKIVVLDDEKMVTSAFKALFKVEGYSDVHLFNNPYEAVAFLENNQPDLVISDFIMPDMNGLEFLKKVKELYPEVSLILLTGYADKENAIRAINEVGLYKYIEKPWDNDDLLFNIRNGIERSNLVTMLKQKIGELELAKSELKKYSENLEVIVAERTAELLQANSKLSGIINYCADGIIIIDKTGKILQANPACENLTGLSESSLCDKCFFDIVNIKDDEYSNLSDLGTDNTETALRNCSIYNDLRGISIPVEINLAVIANADNSDRFVGVIRDISVQKETERLRDDFVATLTHDMRTPLSAAIQTLKFFLDGSLGSLDERQEMLLSTMLKSNEDLLGLVNALLEVYRFESGNLTLCKTNFLIKDLVNQCYEELLPLASKKDLSFGVDFVLDADTIYADRAEIKRVITNLCGNAINYTNKGGEIKVLAKLENDDFIFSVSDNGNGIPANDIPNLFKRFSQGTAKKRSTGTGLGLYLSRQIIEAHGGKIWVESKINKGSEFSFLLTNILSDNKGKVLNGKEC